MTVCGRQPEFHKFSGASLELFKVVKGRIKDFETTITISQGTSRRKSRGERRLSIKELSKNRKLGEVFERLQIYSLDFIEQVLKPFIGGSQQGVEGRDNNQR